MEVKIGNHPGTVGIFQHAIIDSGRVNGWKKVAD